MKREVDRLTEQLIQADAELEDAEANLKQAKIQMAKEKRLCDHKITVALCKRDSTISRYEGGKVVYRPIPPQRIHGETDLARASFNLFGTRGIVGPGPFRGGSWIDWGNPSEEWPPPAVRKFAEENRKGRRV